MNFGPDGEPGLRNRYRSCLLRLALLVNRGSWPLPLRWGGVHRTGEIFSRIRERTGLHQGFASNTQ
jgi:hypothetical protein